MIVIIAVCLAVYFTLPETGSKTLRATVALEDRRSWKVSWRRPLGARTRQSLS
jgi:transposase